MSMSVNDNRFGIATLIIAVPLLCVAGGFGWGVTWVERNRLVVPFNDKAKFAVENGYLKKEHLAQQAENLVEKKASEAIALNFHE